MSVVSKLQIVLEANTTAFDRSLAKVNDTLRGFSKNTAEMHKKMDKFARTHREALDGLQSAGQAAAVGLGVLALGVKGAVTAAVDFEKSMAGVKKVIEFESPAQFKQMEQDIIALSQRLPMAATDIAAIMEAAGQSGIAREELSRFAESAIKMGTAFDISADQAGKAMAEMRAAFGMSQTEVETLADQINYLGNNSTNSAPQIMEVVQRIGSLAETANISSATLAALSASMVGVAPEVAATSLKNFSLQLVKGESLSKSAKAAFKTMGFDYNQVAQDMQTDSEATIRKVLEAAQKVPEHMRAAVLNDAFGSESIAAISQLVTNYEAVDKNLKAMGDSAVYAGSMLKEFEGMAGTSAAQMQVFDNNIAAMKIALGTALLPVLNQAMEAIAPILKAITDWAQKNPELVATITGIVAGVLGVVAVLGGLALAFTAVTSGIGTLLAIGSMIGGFFSVISSGVGIVKMFGAALAALGFPVTAVVAGVAALIAVSVLLYQNWDTIKAKAEEVWFAIGEIVAIAVDNVSHQWQSFKDDTLAKINDIKQGTTDKFNELKANVAAAFASLPTPVKTALTVIGTVVSTRFALIKNAFATAFNAIKALVRGDMQGVATAIRTGLQNAWNIVKTGVSNIAKEFLGLRAKLKQAGIDAIQGFIDGVSEKIDGAIAKARQLASSVIGTVTKRFDIHSPSRVMRELGAWAGEGFVLGVGDKVDDAKQVAENLANALTSTLQDLHRQNFMLSNADNPLADLDYKLQFGELADLTDKQKERLRSLAKINLDIQKTNEATAKALQAQEQSAQNIAQANERSVQNYQSLQKQIALFGNNSKVAEFDYDVKHGKYDGVSDENLANERSTLVQLEQMDNANKAKTAFEQMKGGLAGELSPLAKLQKELDDRLQIIKDFENTHTGVELEAKQARQQAEQAYLTAKNNLMLDNYSNLFNGISGMTKSFFGEQSGIYRAMFAMEKGFAVAKAILALKANIAAASKIGFPQNIPMIAGAVSQGVAIVNDIRSIAMPVGQAHDGIMSVPKSGTWNLEKGERVLPKHTAKALDDKLNSMGSGTKVIINNYTSEKASVEKQDNGDIMVTISKIIDAKIEQRFIKSKRQGWT